MQDLAGNILFVFLLTGAIVDVKCRRLHIGLIAPFGLVGAGFCAVAAVSDKGAVISAAYGIVLGAVFIGLSKISDEKIGMGDALTILVMGLYLGGYNAAFVVLYAMILTSAVSVFMLMFRLGSKKTELPFLPFLLAGYLLHII
ncbi:MAG: prepilin peptidase [Lachnospiraceae bacterium]|nr:prepilin peptidase [Lachnospiraceae bacterium]